MRKPALLLLLWCVLALVSQAQTPCFLAYNEQNQPVETFCVGERITFKDASAGNSSRFYDFDARDGYNLEGPEHIFEVPGTYVVTQLSTVAENTLCPRTFVVKAKAPASPPVIQNLTVLSNGLHIQIQAAAVNDLIVERATAAGGSYTPLDTLHNISAGSTQHALPLSATAGCYRLRVTNICTGQENIVSQTVCSQSLQVSPGDRTNVLSWSANTSSSAVTQYQVLRAGKVYQILSAGQTSFTDEAVACGRTYCYQLVAVLANGSQSVSLEQCQQTQGTTPPAAPFLVVSFNLENQPTVQTMIPADETFQYQSVYRSLNGGVFDLISEKQPENGLDTSLPSFSEQPCYQVAYTDSCNLTSGRSNTACPAILAAQLQPDGSVQLTWQAYEGFPGGIGSQTLELLDEQGTVYWSTPVTGQSYVDAQPQDRYQRLTYRLLTQAQSAAYQSYSNLNSVDQAFQFFLPTAFSPNGDGLNDVFRVIGRFASEFNFQVFNRWGQVIFESHDPQQGWNGTYQGKPVPLGTYLFRLEAVDVNGQRISKKGKVTLVR